ncbi:MULTISPECIES: hypothetical protein [Sphingobacterium]|uniref:hypothetical protein n=1 Tax=Sphingobacterium TaxID=28453 RepID=UPI0013DCCA0A|nr:MULTISPECIES: hypothetical protein [unclassified Sphingobacterium]
MKAISYIKKNSMLLLAGAAVISFSSFKAVEKYLQTSYYWFEYDASGTAILNQTSTPSQTPNPAIPCEGRDVNCAQAFSSYTMVSPGVYAPTPGSEVLDEDGNPLILHKDLQ